MASGIWTSMSGAMAQAQAVDTVANNLANVDTPGFKKDEVTFKEYLSTVERERDGVDIPRLPFKDKDFYPIDGRDQSHVVVNGTHTNFKAGNLRVTQAPLDMALDGPGFFEVSTPTGNRYTRQGSFKMATDGRLVTTEGYPVLAASPGGLAPALPAAAVQPGQGGPTTQGGVAAGQGTAGTQGRGLAAQEAANAARFINLRDAAASAGAAGISVSPSGEIFAGDQPIAKLSVVEFQDARKLRKYAGTLFENRDPANVMPENARTEVRQGAIETSNVNPVEEMTNLIKANRMFEHDLKAMKTYNDLMGREANDIGKL